MEKTKGFILIELLVYFAYCDGYAKWLKADKAWEDYNAGAGNPRG